MNTALTFASRRASCLLAALSAALFLAGCQEQSSTSASPSTDSVTATLDAPAQAEDSAKPDTTFANATQDPDAIKRGGETFALYCATCHGSTAAGGFGPSLVKLRNRKDKREIDEIIKKPSPSMPPLYPATLTDEDIAQVVGYLGSIQVK